MMNDWLDMVQKKNELVREESELIYRLSFCRGISYGSFVLQCVLHFVYFQSHNIVKFESDMCVFGHKLIRLLLK